MTWSGGSRGSAASIGGVDRRQRQTLIALAALLAGALLAVLVLKACDSDGGSTPTRVRAADPLGFVPVDADVIADVDLSAPLPALLYEELTSVPNLPKRGRAVYATKDGQRYLAIQGGRGGSGASLVKDGVLVIAPGQAALTEVVKARRPGARAAFAARVSAMPAGAPVKVAFRPAALLTRLSPKIAASAWGRNQRSGQAALSARGSDLVADVVLDGAASAPDALPFASDAQPQLQRGTAPIVLTVRDPGQTLRFAKDAGLADVLHVVGRLPGFLEPDLEDLGDSATLTTVDLKTVTVRLEPPDPGDWARKLSRLDRLSGLFRTLGLADVRIDRDGDVYTIEEHDKLALRAAVFGDVLVLSTSPTGDLRAAAAAPARKVRGPLSARLSPEFLVRRLLGQQLPTGVVNVGTARARATITPTRLTGRIVLRVTR